MMYSMARQQALPFHRALSRVDRRTGTPVLTSIVVGVLAALVLVVNLKQSAAFTALSSLCIAMLYLAYLGVTGPLLWHRIRASSGGSSGSTGTSAALADGVDEHGKPLFSLGRWGIPVNVIAVVYQVLAIVNLAWPRKSVYDLTGHTWWLQWSAPLFIGIVVVVGVAVHRVLRAGSLTITVGAQEPAMAQEPA
jgi:amino acid transporter